MRLLKIRTTQVPAEEEGRSIIRTELIVIVQCEFSDAHHAIYRDLNQIVATRLQLGAYVLDVRGCKYPDRTICSLPINIQQIKDRLRITVSIKNPIYIDTKCDRARTEDRKHTSKKLKGGYPVERITGKTDVPTYQETHGTQYILSTLNGPSGLLIGEKKSATVKSKSLKYKTNPPINVACRSTDMSNPRTSNGPSGLLIGERNINQSTIRRSKQRVFP